MDQTEFMTALQNNREIEITVTGRKSGHGISLPIWFVQEGEKLYLLPVKGTATQWYKNLREIPGIRLVASGKSLTTEATLIGDETAVRMVVQKFQDKYGTGTINSLYTIFDAAVEISLN